MNELESLAQAGRAGIRVAVAESLTSGLLCSRIGEGEGASTWFAGGVITYLTEAKERLLGLTPGTDPCSADCAVQLATGARRLFQADVAVATTGVGGPDPEAGHSPGTVFVGWAIAGASGSQRLALDGGPDAVLAATVEHALGLLALHSRLAVHLGEELDEEDIARICAPYGELARRARDQLDRPSAGGSVKPE